jgi:hypothetical protein
MAYFLILALGGTLLWVVRSYLAEEDNNYYRHSPGERATHSIGLGVITAAVIWVMTALLVRNVWVDANFKKVVVAEIETFPGVLKYLTQVTELRPLLDFWEELRVIQGGLL